ERFRQRRLRLTRLLLVAPLMLVLQALLPDRIELGSSNLVPEERVPLEGQRLDVLFIDQRVVALDGQGLTEQLDDDLVAGCPLEVEEKVAVGQVSAIPACRAVTAHGATAGQGIGGW